MPLRPLGRVSIDGLLVRRLVLRTAAAALSQPVTKSEHCISFKTNSLKRRSPEHHLDARGLRVNSLTMSYFHTGIRTIIGAKAFHCPVRDGKEWYHFAMVIRLDL